MDVSELLDELGELLEAEQMLLVFDEDEHLIGVSLGPTPMIALIENEVSELWDTELVSQLADEDDIVH